MAKVITVQKWQHIIPIEGVQNSKLTEQRLMGEDQHKWTSKLLGYDFRNPLLSWKWQPGSSFTIMEDELHYHLKSPFHLTGTSEGSLD